MKGIVTTPRKRDDLEARAIETSRRIKLPYVPRNERSYEKIFEETGAYAIYVEGSEEPFVHTRKGKLFFHENTSGMRTGTPGQADTLTKALGLKADHLVLDATLGLATDSLVAASHLGSGRITGLESNPMLADITSRGLKEYTFSSGRLQSAAARIKVVNADHREFLRKCGDDDYDEVYFDPMFQKTVEQSSSMQRLREIAEKAPLDIETVEEACRVARRRVVVKARRGCFGSIEFTSVMPSGNRIIYGIIEV